MTSIEQTEPGASGPLPDAEDQPAPEVEDVERVLYVGTCAGGPMDGRTVTVRYPEGFLCVDKANNLAWVYRAYGDTTALRPVPDDQGRTARPLDEALRLAAVDDTRFDVLAAPDGEEEA